MSSNSITLEQLRELAPPLARFVEAGFVAGFQGPAGVFVVYEAKTNVGTLTSLCTTGERPMRIEPDDGPPWDQTSAKDVAWALAAGSIRTRAARTGLVVSDADIENASVAAAKAVAPLPPGKK